MGQRKLPDHLLLKGKTSIAVGFLGADGNSFTSRIKNWNELVSGDRTTQYRLWRDRRLPDIKGKTGASEIEKLNHTKNGRFSIMDEAQRLDFELIYSSIVDIQNCDLEVELTTAMPTIFTSLQHSWICQLIAEIS